MSNTPETNSRAWSDHSEGILHEVVEANFARKLERERNELREKAERYRIEANSLMLQRDEARESLKHIGEYGTEEINAAIDLRQKLASALVERDEAREALDEEMKWHHRTHTELVETQCKLLDMQMGRDEAQEKYDNLATEHMLVVNKLCEERDEAREQVNRYRYNLDLLPIKWDI